MLQRRHGILEVLLCGRVNPVLWALPKGGLEPGESLEAAALREVREETGVEVSLKDKLGSISYWFTRPAEGIRFHKTVHFFLMAPIGGAIELHDAEFDFVKWFPVDEAARVMTYSNELEMVRRAAEVRQQED